MAATSLLQVVFVCFDQNRRFTACQLPEARLNLGTADDIASTHDAAVSNKLDSEVCRFQTSGPGSGRITHITPVYYSEKAAMEYFNTSIRS